MANIGKVPSQPPIAAGRRPRRDEVVTYRVRIDIKEAKPPIWRRLELGSDMFLNDLHKVLHKFEVRDGRIVPDSYQFSQEARESSRGWGRRLASSGK